MVEFVDAEPVHPIIPLSIFKVPLTADGTLAPKYLTVLSDQATVKS